jgi:hypothetical protein
MAGNKNSGQSIPFRLSEEQLKKRICEFRDTYADGSKGMVTWSLFCAFLGYSEDQVRECYLRGKEKENAYSSRAEMLEKFYTECRALTCTTSPKQQALAKAVLAIDYLAPPSAEDGSKEVRIVFGGGDDRWIEAMR